jgi:broad specificity phosphatase PhoE
MKHLYVCRHGESELNALGRYAGQTDTPLTSHGRSQAHTAGKQAKELALDQIVASPLVRALETAQIIAREINYPPERIVTNRVFMERSLGELEGEAWDESPEDPALYLGIESEAKLNARAKAALHFLRKLDADNVLLVSHGTFLMALKRALGGELAEELPNAHIVEFDLKETEHAPTYVLDR